MADMREFGQMDVKDRGGKHDYYFEDTKHIIASNGLTPSQTIGPFFAYGLTPGPYDYPLKEIHSTDVTNPILDSTEITLEGQIFDANNEPVHDAMVELIQADNKGEYRKLLRNDGFTGYLRAGTGATDSKDSSGNPRYVFKTIKPMNTSDSDAPFVTIIITMRGLLNHCITRAYFGGDDYSNDSVLLQVPEDRRQTLIAKKMSENHYRFDIHMQGENETVFFDI